MLFARRSARRAFVSSTQRGTSSGAGQAGRPHLDKALMRRPGNLDIQMDLSLDYANNVKMYPPFQQYFRQSRVKLLAIWGMRGWKPAIRRKRLLSNVKHRSFMRLASADR